MKRSVYRTVFLITVQSTDPVRGCSDGYEVASTALFRGGDVWLAGAAPGAEVALLEHGVEAEVRSFGTEPGAGHAGVGVFGGEHDFTALHEGFHVPVSAAVGAVFGDREVVMGQEVPYLGLVVFHGDGEAAFVSLIGEPFVVANW